MCGGLDHSSCSAGWAEAATLTGESDKVLVPAAIALYPQETMFEAPAAQVLTELFDDEGGQRRVVQCQFTGKRRQVLFNNRVERSLFRFVAPVAVADGDR